MASVPRRKLPIGIQTFRKVREGDCYYVDKTRYLERLADTDAHYFLSRPRRFGKSLLLDTFKELFEARRSYSKGSTSTAAGIGRSNTPSCGSTSAKETSRRPATCTATRWRNWTAWNAAPA